MPVSLCNAFGLMVSDFAELCQIKYHQNVAISDFPKQINKQSIKCPKLFQPSLRCVGLIVDRVKRSFISLHSKKTMMDFDKNSRMDRLLTD